MYFYSEGYIYKGEKTICKMYGTEEEQNEEGNLICYYLNKQSK